MTKLDRYFWLMLLAAGSMIYLRSEVGAASVFIVAAMAIDIYRDGVK